MYLHVNPTVAEPCQRFSQWYSICIPDIVIGTGLRGTIPCSGLLSQFALKREKEFRKLGRPRIVITTTFVAERALDWITNSVTSHENRSSVAKGRKRRRERSRLRNQLSGEAEGVGVLTQAHRIKLGFTA
jgi:hypothetical protein